MTFTEYFTDIANAIRERFGLSREIYINEFANLINGGSLIEIDQYDTYYSYIGKVLTATADAIKSYIGSSAPILGADIPKVIRNLKLINYGSLQYATQSNVTWTSKPSVPSVSISKKSYTLTWEYYWSHTSYDSYKIDTVSITPHSTSIYNPAKNLKDRLYGGDVVDDLEVRCSLTRTIDLSGLINNMQSLGAPESEILAEMSRELNSAIGDVNSLAGTFSFKIGYYGGTYI